MSLVLLALGSRGDVQPMAALAGELTRRGGDARVVATADFADLVADHGALFVPIAADSRDAVALTHAPFAEHLFSTRVGQALLLRRWVSDIADPVAAAALAATQSGDTILTGVLTRDLAIALATGRGGRAVTVLHTGQLPTAHAESHFARDSFRGSARYNRGGSALSWRVTTSLGMPASAPARAALDLPRGRSATATAEADRSPVLIAASPLVVPPAPDWPANAHQTGYLAGPATAYEPDPGLAHFLAAAEAPVYVGFGSLGASGAFNDLSAVLDAARLSGRRIVTPAVGGAPVGRASRLVYAIADVPHEWLFSRMAAVVHHGGAGTTWAGLRSGRPSAAVPFGVDQPYHGSRLHDLGVGPEPLAVQDLSAISLARMITRLTTGEYDARAAEVGARARTEDGLGETISALEALGCLA